MRRRGFTLTELYLTLALTTLLGCVLAPVARRAHAHRRLTTCTDRLKQVALGALQYISDYDEMFACSTPKSTWRARQAFYMPTLACFACPSDSGLNVAAGLDRTGSVPVAASYWGNCLVFQDGHIPRYPGMGGRPDNPAKTIMAIEYGPGPRAGGYADPPLTAAAQLPISHSSQPAGVISASDACAVSTGPASGNWSRHGGLLNCAFLDGHVKALHRSQLTGGAHGSQAVWGPYPADGLFQIVGIP